MLLALLASPAFAAPSLGLVAGPVIGFGGSPDATWATASPMLGATLGLHLAFFEVWGGVTAQALQEADYDSGELGPHMINPVTADLGFGFGGQTFSAGLYGGVGFTGFERGVYGRLNIGRGHVRMGVEWRLYALGDGYDNTGAAALLYRVEVGGKHRPPPPPPPPPAPPPPPVYHEDPYGT